MFDALLTETDEQERCKDSQSWNRIYEMHEPWSQIAK